MILIFISASWVSVSFKLCLGFQNHYSEYNNITTQQKPLENPPFYPFHKLKWNTKWKHCLVQGHCPAEVTSRLPSYHHVNVVPTPDVLYYLNRVPNPPKKGKCGLKPLSGAHRRAGVLPAHGVHSGIRHCFLQSSLTASSITDEPACIRPRMVLCSPTRVPHSIYTTLN